jgi:hypothetical protein
VTRHRLERMGQLSLKLSLPDNEREPEQAKCLHGLSFVWAWADSNGRPHAYQAAPGGSGTPQPVTKTQTGRAICQRSTSPPRDRAR